ncbi:DnaB-like helicase C-terminal domain-containing protein [Loigolactobacillus jiayinensis]|uniref:DnaB-like helicase C-terminal domain-containing protein n=1 Tax=Loigolactobacillus jiayinensis TaxID=2486016 RepID=A0ABW1RCJ7_9LACO|nr:DnaB-like helicase C-terminal domain-containing protein [Loigolactobacillus jiayinensis]
MQFNNYREAESGVLGGLLRNPLLVQTVVVLPDYFSNVAYQNLCRLLYEINGDFSDWYQVKAEYDAKYPNVMTNDDWDNLINSYIGRALFATHLKILHQHYDQLQLQDASMKYLQNPNDDNLFTLQMALASMKEPEKVKVETAKDLQDGFEQELVQDMPEGIKTFKLMNSALNGGLRGGNLFVLGARPAVGKSAFALNLLLNAATYNEGFCGDLFSLEMRNVENRNRMLANETGIAVSKFHNAKHRLNDVEKQKARNTMKRFTKMGIQFYDNFQTPSQIIAQIRSRALATKRGHYLAVVDYLQLLHSDQRTENRVQEIGSITRAFKVLTNELDIPIILLSQLNRASLQKQEDTLADLRESGSIEQDANVVAFLSNVDDPNNSDDRQRVQLSFKKNREGKLAKFDFNFYKDVQTFAETF